MRSHIVLTALFALSIAGCGTPNDPLPIDSGTDAGGRIDAHTDARIEDDAGLDGGIDDAGEDDAQVGDDAQIGEDAQVGDAGTEDAGGDASMPDAGSDAGMPDAGTDGGPPDGGPMCGDGTATGAEECDGADLGGADCVDRGFAGGTLGCTGGCTFDTGACFRCGDGSIDPGESCDGAALGGETCGTRGFDGGALACSSSCTFVTTGCFDCGDGTINGTEQCDGSALGAATCMSRGFDGGVLTCSPSCTFVTAMCFDCGDGVINGTEQCDGAMLGGATCTSRPGGFTGGTLGCSATCAYDTSACTTCGNGTAEGAEECDGTDLRMQTCATRPGFMSGALACTTSCAYDTTGCSALPTPSAAGQIVITEIMQDPSAFADADGEWFEVLNRSAGSLNLQGCRVRGTGGAGDVFTITTSLVLAPGAYATFSPATMMSGPPGFTPSYRWPGGFALANASDGITLECGTTAIDTVLYDGGPRFPDPTGASMTLSPASLDATANDDGFRWCLGTSVIGATTDRGTPGAANDACESFTIGFCRLQFPPTIMGTPGGATTVFGRVYAMGLTDRTTGTDTHYALLGEVGVGPDGSDPASAAGWTWTRATANAGYGPASPGYEVNNDEYQASLMHPGAGSHDYAYRFSGDRGATWTYCDTGAGSSDGYAAAAAGQMTITAPTTTDVLYFSEYVEGTSNNKALEIYNAGTTTVDLTTCSIRIYTNGATTSTSLALTGTLAPGATFVACNMSATIPVASCTLRTTSAVLGFNGDDALDLVCGGVVLDVIGQIGFRPVTEWGTGLASTSDNTLRRNCTVVTGDPNGADVFTPSTEWTGFATDTFDGLGPRGCP